MFLCIFVSPSFPGLTKETKCPNQVFYVWLVYMNCIFGLNTAWKIHTLQMMILVNVCSTWIMVEIKTRFDTWITRNDIKGLILFNLSYLITFMPYLCSQWSPKFKIKYFVFDWSIYRLSVLNRAWKRVSIRIIIFLYSCSTWGLIELKTRNVAWITRNDVNGVSLFPFLI
jgi:hypothetical protein